VGSAIKWVEGRNAVNESTVRKREQKPLRERHIQGEGGGSLEQPCTDTLVMEVRKIQTDRGEARIERGQATRDNGARKRKRGQWGRAGVSEEEDLQK